MSRTLDEGLHVLGPGTGDEFSHGVQLGKLGSVVGVGSTTWTETVAQREGHVVLCHDVADVVEMFIEERLAVVYQTPFAHDGAAARHDAAQA